jgi:hypothetical protein
MQPTAQTGIVWKISIFLFILLAVVLYKMNDYFKQEKYSLAKNQLRTQIVSLKTSVSSQISTLKNVLSSYEYDLNESKINWVQLDPFFGIAKAERIGGRGSNDFRVTQFIGRSGSIGANWNASFLQKALTRQISSSDQPITVQMFRDAAGTKFMSLRFTSSKGQALIVVGSAEYFQKYFDLSRGGKTTALLETTDHILAAHSEADYIGSSIDENAVSPKKFLVEREEIAGTNLIAMNFTSRSSLAKGFVVPWSVVGLIFGFGFLIIGVLIYTLEPIERRIEKYKMQEREQIFKETLSTSLAQQAPIEEKPVTSAVAASEKFEEEKTFAGPPPIATATDLVKSKLESFAAENTAQEDEESEEMSILSLPKAPVSAVPPPPVQVNLPLTPPPIPTPAAEAANALSDLEKVEKSKSMVRTGSVVIDSTQIEGLEYMPADTDHIDLDQALSLDEIETEEVAQNSVQVIKENLTPKTINASQQINTNDLSKPSFALRRKEFKVDAIEVPIRRPERT